MFTYTHCKDTTFFEINKKENFILRETCAYCITTEIVEANRKVKKCKSKTMFCELLYKFQCGKIR